MRKIIVQTKMLPDGALDRPELWNLIFDYHNHEMDEVYFKSRTAL